MGYDQFSKYYCMTGSSASKNVKVMGV